MALSRVTAPTLRPVGLQETKDWTKIDSETDDATVEALIEAAIAHLDGADGILNRALLTQTWDYYRDRFPCWSLNIPLPPLQSVTGVYYVDEAGAEQTLDPANYRVDTKSEPGRIEPAYGLTWPVTRCVSNAVRIRFVAGWTAPAAVPGNIRFAIMALVAYWESERIPVAFGGAAMTLPHHVGALLAPHRVMFF